MKTDRRSSPMKADEWADAVARLPRERLCEAFQLLDAVSRLAEGQLKKSVGRWDPGDVRYTGWVTGTSDFYLSGQTVWDPDALEPAQYEISFEDLLENWDDWKVTMEARLARLKEAYDERRADYHREQEMDEYERLKDRFDGDPNTMDLRRYEELKKKYG